MKNKFFLFIVMLVISTMNSIAQNSNDVFVTDTRISKPYHFIQIKGEMNVKIVQDEMPGVVVEGNNYQVGNTVTMLRNDTLFVYQTNTRIGDRRTRVIINADNLVLLDVTGKTRVDCSGLVNSDYLTVRAKDGAQIKLDVRAIKVESKVTGCSFIILSGSTVSNVEATDGCGNIDSHSLDVMDRKGTSKFMCSEC